MLLRKISIENARSFLDKQELILDGPISIIIGPNGGGKTNLLDTIVVMLRRYLFASMYAASVPTPEQPVRFEFRYNDSLSAMDLERHSRSPGKPQIIEVEIEATTRDIQNMQAMKDDSKRIVELAGKKYINLTVEKASRWRMDTISSGQRFTYKMNNGNLEYDRSSCDSDFLEYLQIFEIYGRLRNEYDFSPLSTPMIYLHVNRSVGGFQSNVDLPNYDEVAHMRQNDAAFSRQSGSIVTLAIGRLAQKFRLLLEKDKGVASKEFREDKNLIELTRLLNELGYEWSLECINPLKNQYDVRLKKQGSSFLVSAASSGERELLTYLFASFALNVRDALIVVDEPELHLHPQWQLTLLKQFAELAKSTGNQFLLATHSPTFVSPESIQYVSRVFSREQMSHIDRLDTAKLPEMKHLINIVNSQNNERLFFADRIVLVEGISDRLFFEKILDLHGRSAAAKPILEVISVGGKGFFNAYRSILLACQIEHSVIADLDFIEEIGSGEIKSFFKIDRNDIKKDVIDNVGSVDAETLVSRIDEAIKHGNWNDASETWEYIKSRRRKLRADLNDAEKEMLKAFLRAQRETKIYVLSKGSLEDYLPTGYKSKDLKKVIDFLSQENFWGKIPQDARQEIEEICRLLLSDAVSGTGSA